MPSPAPSGRAVQMIQADVVGAIQDGLQTIIHSES
jgi:hypothetical protein